MSKIYFNNYHNRAIVINEQERTYTIKRATDVKMSGGFSYLVKMVRLFEIKKSLYERGFARV